jgi:hypothetical protein
MAIETLVRIASLLVVGATGAGLYGIGQLASESTTNGLSTGPEICWECGCTELDPPPAGGTDRRLPTIDPDASGSHFGSAGSTSEPEADERSALEPANATTFQTDASGYESHESY